MHTLRWNPGIRRWVVEFAAQGRSHVIGFYASGQGAADLVNSLNGGQPVAVTEERRGKLGVPPQPTTDELQKQLAELAGATDATGTTGEKKQ